MKKGKDSSYLWGLHACRAALKNPERHIRGAWVTESTAKEFPSLMKASFDVKLVDSTGLNKLLPEGAVHQGIALKADPLPDPYLQDCLGALDEQAKIIVLDHVTDPHNVGAIIRTAAALGAKALVLTDKHSPPLAGTLAKTACGGLEVLPIIKVTNLARAMEEIQQMGFWTVGLDESGQHTISEAKLDGKLALVMGAEGEGLRRLTREHCDHMVKLPTTEEFSTLNVSVATAIALYELVR